MFASPLILLAYGRALFNLGSRYETAVGSRRNVEEAARCYWKAARLGDAAARGRYGAASLGVDSTPHDPPPLPQLPADFVEPPPPFATVYRPYGS
jgi:TPR repeat protein